MNVAETTRGRTVAIVCQGPSAPFVSKAGRPEWCYASINRARLVEDLCPNPLELVYCSSPLRLSQEREWLNGFAGTVVTTTHGKNVLKRRVVVDDDNPAHGPMNTLSALLFCLMRARVDDIVLFGCDGRGPRYYRNEEYGNEKPIDVAGDSRNMNERFWSISKTYVPDWKGSILLAQPNKGDPNCSAITCFSTVDIDNLRERGK